MEFDERAGELEREFLLRLSHELRTPLNAVLGFAELMASDDREPLSRRQRERLAQVVAAGSHLLAMVNKALHPARAVSDASTYVMPGAVGLSAAVQECVAMLAPMAAEAGVTLRWEGAQDDVDTVGTDPVRLRQVLLNLVSNGVKYNRLGGWVQLATARRGDQALVIVRDNGLGIPAAHTDQLYRPFHRAGRETSGIEGSGLGLAQVKLLVEQMGGAIEFDSQEGQGSEFRLLLPRPSAASSQGAGAASVPR